MKKQVVAVMLSLAMCASTGAEASIVSAAEFSSEVSAAEETESDEASVAVDSAFVSALRVLDDLIAHLLRGKPLEAIHLGLYIARVVEEAAFGAGIELFFHLLVHLFDRQSARYRIEIDVVELDAFLIGTRHGCLLSRRGFRLIRVYQRVHSDRQGGNECRLMRVSAKIKEPLF